MIQDKRYFKGEAYSQGYKPSKKNKEIYYKRIYDKDILCLILFLNFEGYSRYPKFSSKLIKEMPNWKINRLLKKEMAFLQKKHFLTLACSYTLVDGYCKNCYKDLKDDSLFCTACFRKVSEILIEKGKRYVAKQINNNEVCSICGRRLSLNPKKVAEEFITSIMWKDQDVYALFLYDEKLFGKIIDKIIAHFDKFPDQHNHHICYNEDFTIPLCASCHGYVTHSSDPAYTQYKPVDKLI